jgi:hypothetical protein
MDVVGKINCKIKQYCDVVSFFLQLANMNNFSLDLHKAQDGTPVDINQNMVSEVLRKALNYFSAIQAHDGHWPGDFPGPLFTTATMV